MNKKTVFVHPSSLIPHHFPPGRGGDTEMSPDGYSATSASGRHLRVRVEESSPRSGVRAGPRDVPAVEQGAHLPPQVLDGARVVQRKIGPPGLLGERQLSALPCLHLFLSPVALPGDAPQAHLAG